MPGDLTSPHEKSIIAKDYAPSFTAMTTNGLVNGEQCSILLDSGAGYCFVDANYVTRRNLQMKEKRCKDMNVLTANGGNLEVSGVIDLDVTLGKETFSHRFFVTKGLVVPLLIGNEFLFEHDVAVWFRKLCAIIEDAPVKIDIFNENSPSRDNDFSVRLLNDVELPANSEVFFDDVGFVNEELARQTVQTVVVEPHRRLTSSGASLARTLVNTMCKIPLRFINSTSEVIKLRKGMSVGTLDVVDKKSISTVAVLDAKQNTKEDHQQWDRPSFIQQIHLPEKLTAQQKEQITQFLWSNRQLFALNPKRPGNTEAFTHSIDVEEHPPIYSRPYRVSPTEAKQMNEEISSMLEADIISPSTSPWSAPVILVPKKDGSLRFCVDYRKLNNITKRDVYPLPRIDDTIEALNGMKYFSALDLASGYWQIPVDKRDREKTAFSTRMGHYEFNVMPFGLTNAPATFQRTMDIVLAGLKWQTCLVYLDDIIIFSRDFKTHLANLKSVFNAIQKHQFKLKLDKCHFLMEEVSFLGHIISERGVTPDPSKTRDIQDFPVPRCVKDVRSFLGLCGYYGNHVQNFALIASPLYLLTRKNAYFRWTDECQRSFEDLKKTLISRPILAFPDFSKQFIVTTDASDVGLGATLSQKHNDQEVVVSYASHALTQLERNYSATEKECLAVKWAIDKFRPYIYGSKFIVHTDHWALQWLQKFKNPSGRLARWALSLQEYDFEVIHRPGRQVPHVDALSRYPSGEIITTPQKASITTPINLVADEWNVDLLQLFRDAQNRDRALDELRLRAQLLSTKKNNSDQPERFFLEDGILYRMWKPRTNRVRQTSYRQLVVPASLRHEVMYACHEDVFAGHQGVEKTLSRIHQRFYWPGMKADIQYWVDSCLHCASKKNPKAMVIGRLYNIPVPNRPWHTVGIDFMGPFQTSERGNRYILVVTDYLTKWPEAFAVPDQKETTVARILVEELFCRYGPPRRLLSDRGRQFLGTLVSSIYKMWGVTKLTTAAYHPQTDGLTERFNKTLAYTLSMYVSEHHRDWDHYLPYALYAYRTSVHSSTREMPYTLLFGVDPWIPIDIALTKDTSTPIKQEDIHNYRDEVRHRLEEVWKLAKDNIEVAQTYQATNYNKGRIEKEYAIGSQVWIYLPVVKKKHTTKLTHFWCGPFEIVEQITPVTYRVKGVNKRKLDGAIHVTRMKPYLNPEAQIPEPPETLDDPNIEINEHFLELPVDIAIQQLDDDSGNVDDKKIEEEIQEGREVQKQVQVEVSSTSNNDKIELQQEESQKLRKHPDFIEGFGIAEEILQEKKMSLNNNRNGLYQHYLVRFRDKGPQHNTWIIYNQIPRKLITRFQARSKPPPA